jgi:hypothetical protein
MGGLMLVAIAFLGEYVWRILDEVRGAPPFIEARHAHAAGRAPDGPDVRGTPETTLERTPSTGRQINSGEPAPVGPLRGHDGLRTSGEAKASESLGGKGLPKQIDHEVVQRS